MARYLLNNQRLCVKLDKTDATIFKYQHSIITKYHHSSIKITKKKFVDQPTLNFQAVYVVDVKKTFMELKTDKVVSGEIPVKLLKDSDVSFHALTSCIKDTMKASDDFKNKQKSV